MKVNDKKIKLLLALLIAIFAIGFVWLKYTRPQQLNPTASKADEPPMHWKYRDWGNNSNVLLVDTSNNNFWRTYLANAVKNWEESGAVKYHVFRPGRPTAESRCPVYTGGITYCIYDDPRGMYIAYGVYNYWPDTGHMIYGYNVFSNSALNGNTPYSTPEVRNYLSCLYLGMATGARIRDDFPEDSCMNPTFSFDTVAKMQNPDTQDLDTLKEIYDHVDGTSFGDNSSSKIPDPVKYADEKSPELNWGTKISTSKDGHIETYQLDLDDGSIMKTIAIKK